jgi:hypothetical protein
VETRIPPKLSELFDLAVAGMLVLVGLRGLRSGLARSVVETRTPQARQSLLIGIVHGLAGSGWLTALVVSNLSSTSARLTYIALFGAGLIASMALLSGVAGWPLARLARHPWAGRVITGAAGAVSVALGVVWAYPMVIRIAG